MSVFKAEVVVTLKKKVLDPQGKAVANGLQALGFNMVSDVRVGKHIEMMLEVDTKPKAEEHLEKMCKKLLANPVIEDYKYKVVELK